MYTNTDMTLYSCGKDGKYTRSVIKGENSKKGVFWQEVKQSNIEKIGLTSADSVKIFIPASSAPNGLKITTSKDIVVKGEIAFEFDNTSTQTIASSLTSLKSSNDVYTVTVFDGKLYGSNNIQHYQLSCK
ncbi:MAG TPA: DUF6751 family protein [Mobilitalea sp.]|nr:DUF6751 family protein [Mobilitalea sp.]